MDHGRALQSLTIAASISYLDEGGLHRRINDAGHDVTVEDIRPGSAITVAPPLRTRHRRRSTTATLPQPTQLPRFLIPPSSLSCDH
jgi:hypothetical protein